MRRRTPLEFDISVSADKKKRARARGMSGAVETSSRKCDQAGCEKPGKYRAPKSVDNPDEFHWFCLDHVRAFNQKWNFFDAAAAPRTERKALDILGAKDDMTKAEIRKVYKALVKDLHPDTNSGSRADEDRLTEVVWAWDQVKASRSFRD